MRHPFPVRDRAPAAPATRALVIATIRRTGGAAAERAGSPADPALPRWSPYRLPGAPPRRIVGRLDRFVVEHAARLRR